MTRLIGLVGLLLVIGGAGTAVPALARVETFDTTAAGGLPPGWSLSFGVGGRVWDVRPVSSRSAPNALMLDPINNNTTSEVTSAPYTVPGAGPVELRFYRRYVLEDYWDGFGLLISVNGGPFTDVETAGGTFLTGGYDISAGPGSPGYWSGSQSSFVETRLRTAPLLPGDQVQFRWEAFFDMVEISGDLFIDDVEISQAPPPPPVIPTMTEWAMILFGLMLAGGAALALQGRRAVGRA